MLEVKKKGSGFSLLVSWEGVNPETKEPWADSWEPRGNLKKVEKNHPEIAEKITSLIAKL